MKALIVYTKLFELTKRFFRKRAFSGGEDRPPDISREALLRKNAELERLVEEKTQEGIAHERRFRSLIENGMEVITLMDEHFYPIYRSPASYRLTGWTMEERQKTGLLSLTHSDDVKGVQEIIANLLASPGKSFRITYRTLHKDGYYIWLDGSMINLLHEENIRAIIANLHDITESKKAEALLLASYEEVRLLASHLQDVREEERTNMAREIHDELGQQLTGLKMDISWLNRRPDLNDEASRDKIKGILTLVDSTVNTVRRLAAELRPSILDDLGLAEALEWHCKEFQKRSGTQCTFLMEGEKHPLPPAISTGLFRIYQEALTNVARHAGAQTVNASLRLDPGQVSLTISDDGKGFDVKGIGSKKTLGLLGMKERTLMMGGRYEFISGPDQGTTVKVSVPLEKDFPEIE
jgi:PAS domain S-box-containing protein